MSARQFSERCHDLPSTYQCVARPLPTRHTPTTNTSHTNYQCTHHIPTTNMPLTYYSCAHHIFTTDTHAPTTNACIIFLLSTCHGGTPTTNACIIYLLPTRHAPTNHSNTLTPTICYTYPHTHQFDTQLARTRLNGKNPIMYYIQHVRTRDMCQWQMILKPINDDKFQLISTPV